MEKGAGKEKENAWVTVRVGRLKASSLLSHCRRKILPFMAKYCITSHATESAVPLTFAIILSSGALPPLFNNNN